MFVTGRRIFRTITTKAHFRELVGKKERREKMDTKEMEDEEQHRDTFDGYIAWIKALRCEVSTGLTATALRDCVGFAEILHRIDGEFFSEHWVEKVFSCAEDSSWRIRANNLKKVLAQVADYLEKHADRSIKGHPYWVIDEQMFADAGSLVQMNKVLTLIVAAACMGRFKKDFVQLTRDQTEHVQSVVVKGLTDIQENSYDSASADAHTSNGISGSQHNHSHVNEGEDTERVNQLARENEELRANLIEKESELEEAKQQLYELKQSPSVDILATENNELREKKAILDNRVLELEMNIELANNNLDRKETELEELKEKMDKIHVFEEQYNSMKDEIDELRAKELEHVKLVRENELLKQRAKDSANIRAELNVLRDTNARYVAEMVTLEDEKKKTQSLRQQICALKAQRDEKEREGEKLFIRLNKLESELADAKSRLAIAEKKNEDHVYEKLQLKEKVTELEFSGVGDTLQTSLNGTADHDKSYEENRSRILEQERELSHLRERVCELEELEKEKREYDTTKGRIREMEGEIQLAAGKKAELMETIEKLEHELENRQFNGDNTELKVQLERKSVEIDRLKERLETAERQANQDDSATKKLNDLLLEKDAQVEKMTEQLKKAKQLLVDQEQRLSCSDEGGLSRHEFDSLRREIEQKDRQIKRLNEELESSNTKHEEEQRLVTTAFYGMAQRVNETSRREVSDSHDRSFLAKQKDANRPNLSYFWLIGFLLPWVLLLIAVFCQNLVVPPPDLV